MGRDATEITVYKNLSLENMEGEEWIDIVDYEGLYKISNMGRVKTMPRRVYGITAQYRDIEEAIKRQFTSDSKYLRVELSKDGVNKKYAVNQLVGIHFIPNPENKPEVNHMYGNTFDNRWFNLEWATKSENRRHAITVLGAGTGSPWKNCKKEDHPMFGRRGENAPSSIPIICNENGKRYVSIKEASVDLGIPATTIKYAIYGITKNPKHGYTFKYVE